jgi:serine/threonine protein kinase
MEKQRPGERIIDTEDIPIVDISNFKIDSLIGKGGFGNVYRGIWEGMDVAIKQWHLENLENDLLQEFINEAKIMHKCRHPNIVLFFAICIKQGKDSLIMEYLPNGSLYKNLSNLR